VADFNDQDLAGSTFDDVQLLNAKFRMVDFTGSELKHVRFKDVSILGELVNVEIEADLDNVRINGVDIVPLVEAELNRRDPDRGIIFGARTAAEIRTAWDTLQQLWEPTIARLRSLAPDLLHERVDGEWSAVQTLRHLVFATDSWILRAVLGDPSPYHPLDLPYDEMPDIPGIPRDYEVRPSLDEILDVRADRIKIMTELVSRLTDGQLDGMTEPVEEVGYPESEAFPVRGCVRCILIEEWEHRRYLERDLDRLTAR